MLLLWVETGGVRELSIVVLGIESSLGSLAHSDVVGDVLAVREVLVQVVLEVLDQVHVLLDQVVSSHSGEGEGGVVQLPSVHGELWVLALLGELSIDLHSIGVVLHVEASGEVV